MTGFLIGNAALGNVSRKACTLMKLVIKCRCYSAIVALAGMTYRCEKKGVD